jgi:hypothetical protein
VSPACVTIETLCVEPSVNGSNEPSALRVNFSMMAAGKILSV